MDRTSSRSVQSSAGRTTSGSSPTPSTSPSPQADMSPFADAISVAPGGDGTYRAVIDESWNLRPLPQGGIITAAALRAMEAELGDGSQRLRTSHTLFVGQVADGELDVQVEVLRRGRSMSH